MGKKSQLGDLQLAVLEVLWEQDEATVAQVQDVLREERNPAKSTVATVLSRLERQNLVSHRTEAREFVYRALVSRGQVRRSMVDELVDSLFGGDPSQLVSHLVSSREIDRGDLEQLRGMLDHYDAGPSEAS